MISLILVLYVIAPGYVLLVINVLDGILRYLLMEELLCMINLLLKLELLVTVILYKK